MPTTPDEYKPKKRYIVTSDNKYQEWKQGTPFELLKVPKSELFAVYYASNVTELKSRIATSNILDYILDQHPELLQIQDMSILRLRLLKILREQDDE